MTHYEILGLERTASFEDISKAYRKLALIHHPDRNPDKVAEATMKFKEITASYSVLSDPNKKFRYDQSLPKPKVKPKVKKPTTQEEILDTILKQDPNLGNIWDAPPPTKDLWGNPLPKQVQEPTRAYRKQRKVILKPEDVFIDAFSKQYLKEGSPNIRGNK